MVFQRTLIHSAVLEKRILPSTRRPEHRRDWLECVYERLNSANLVFVYPDNGLEVQGIDRHAQKGPKFTYFDDLIQFAGSRKSLIIYQHATRQGDFTDQLRRRLHMLRSALTPYITHYAVLRFRRVNARAFMIAMTGPHAPMMGNRIAAFVAGLWGDHFTLF